MSILIVGEPSTGRIRIVKAIGHEDGALFIGDVSFNAMLIAHANTYDEALQICEEIENGD